MILSNPSHSLSKEFDKIMKKNNISRKECLLLPVHTILNALNKKSL